MKLQLSTLAVLALAVLATVSHASEVIDPTDESLVTTEVEGLRDDASTTTTLSNNEAQPRHFRKVDYGAPVEVQALDYTTEATDNAIDAEEARKAAELSAQEYERNRRLGKESGVKIGLDGVDVNKKTFAEERADRTRQEMERANEELLKKKYGAEDATALELTRLMAEENRRNVMAASKALDYKSEGNLNDRERLLKAVTKVEPTAKDLETSEAFTDKVTAGRNVAKEKKQADAEERQREANLQRLQRLKEDRQKKLADAAALQERKAEKQKTQEEIERKRTAMEEERRLAAERARAELKEAKEKKQAEEQARLAALAARKRTKKTEEPSDDSSTTTPGTTDTEPSTASAASTAGRKLSKVDARLASAREKQRQEEEALLRELGEIEQATTRQITKTMQKSMFPAGSRTAGRPGAKKAPAAKRVLSRLDEGDAHTDDERSVSTAGESLPSVTSDVTAATLQDV